MDPLSLFVTFLKVSALSVGGSSSLPLLRQDLHGLVTDDEILKAITIGRLSTGPSGLFVVSLGYFAMGWLGALIALVASSLAPLILVPAAGVMRKQLLSSWFAGLVRGVALSTSGLLVATTLLLLAPNGRLLSWWQLALVAAGAVIGYEGKRHPAVIVAAGAVIGLLLAR